jgi:hypothetical protein
VSVLVLVDGIPTWSVSSLHGAKELAVRYAYDGRCVELFARNASELNTWRFDHERWAWVESVLERIPSHPVPCGDLKLAA